jgi:hypothetical protein
VGSICKTNFAEVNMHLIAAFLALIFIIISLIRDQIKSARRRSQAEAKAAYMKAQEEARAAYLRSQGEAEAARL